MTTMRGPLNLSMNDEVGTLIDGFDEPPMVMMTYNPRYYPGLIEGNGYGKAMDLWAWIFNTEGKSRQRTGKAGHASPRRSCRNKTCTSARWT